MLAMLSCIPCFFFTNFHRKKRLVIVELYINPMHGYQAKTVLYVYPTNPCILGYIIRYDLSLLLSNRWVTA